MSFFASASCADAPPCRPPPSAAAPTAACAAHMRRLLSRVARAWAHARTAGASARQAPCASILAARLTPRARQKASNSSSKRAKSERREANKARIAARKLSGRSASGPAISRAASCASACPMTKPAPRSVSTKPARRRRIAGPGPEPSTAKACAPITRPCPTSRLVVSGLIAARSSRVLSSAIRVAWTISGSWRRSSTPSPASVAAQSSVSATPGTFFKSSLRSIPTMRAIWNAKFASRLGLAGEQNRRLAIDVGKIEIMVEAAAAQRVGEFAGGVRGQDDARDR